MEQVKLFRSARITISFSMQLKGTPDKIFPLLCPAREYDWIEPWACNLIFTYTGYAEQDCVFQTDSPGDGGLETWVVTRYEPNKTIQFIRTNKIKVIRYTIDLIDNLDGTSSVVWEQLITGLNDEGNKYIFEYTDDKYVEQMSNLEKMLSYYLETGEMLKLGKMGYY